MPETKFTDDQQAALFLDGLGKIIVDLEKASSRDHEALMLIGSLADRLCADAGQPNWPEVKKGLSEAESQKLVGDFARQIEDAGTKGQIRIAYAMQALASSLVGARFSDPRIKIGVNLLDEFIGTARNYYLHNTSKPN